MKPFRIVPITEGSVARQVQQMREDFNRRPEFYREAFGLTTADEVRKYARKLIADSKVYHNDDYQVTLYNEDEPPEGWPKLIHLSICRNDRAPIHDWRILQDIKNTMVGPEHEGVELYPAESRLVDTANQYHLYVIADPRRQWPFGFRSGRAVTSAQPGGVGKQRPREACCAEYATVGTHADGCPGAGLSPGVVR